MGVRDYKNSGPGEFFHIYNRGNNKQDIFLNDGDYSFFMLRLKQNLYPDRFDELTIQPMPPNSFSLISYCLMPNHFHLVIKQNADIPTSKLLLKICASYSKTFNKKYDRIGHVFQDQFKQAHIDSDEYLKWVIAYVCQNPKVAGLVKNPADYKWSSYAEHINSSKNTLCDKKLFNEVFKNFNFKDFIESVYDLIRNKKMGEKVETSLLLD